MKLQLELDTENALTLSNRKKSKPLDLNPLYRKNYDELLPK